MRYFRILDDLDNYPNKWLLGDLVFSDKSFVNVWPYIETHRDKNSFPKYEEMLVRVIHEGIPDCFHFSSFEVPIVNEEVKEIIGDDFAFYIPIVISNFNKKISNRKHYILIIKNEVDCIDETLSVYNKFQEGDALRPDLAGQYSVVYKLIVKKGVYPSIFRLKNYNVAIIVNEIMMEKLCKLRELGVKFLEV